ncbi:hypothetical protein [Bilophila wadsworthia]|uniref:hypothetical protein n=1 Tax=Bilophila wadsworthia TaxID=35833 RepID=UPI00242FE3F0|nr:hypothetical protein [Bilophila wadsworthia]
MESKFKVTSGNLASYQFYFINDSPIDITPLNKMEIKNVFGLDLKAEFDLVIIDVWEKEFIPAIDPYQADLTTEEARFGLYSYIKEHITDKVVGDEGNIYSVYDANGSFLFVVDYSWFDEGEGLEDEASL